LPRPASADDFYPPPVPGNIQVPAGSKLFLVGHATGTQNYICLAAGSSYTWTFLGPQATLFDDEGEQITTHFLSPSTTVPTGAPTWQDSRDTSTVWALAIESSTDSAFVAPGAIPWLKLQKADTKVGPTGGDRLTATTFIQRLNTTGGVIPATGCSTADDYRKKAFVPYTADYYFYK
jgi:hypothetical protein